MSNPTNAGLARYRSLRALREAHAAEEAAWQAHAEHWKLASAAIVTAATVALIVLGIF